MSEVAYGSSAKLAFARQLVDLQTARPATGNPFLFFPAANFRLGQDQAFEGPDLLGLGRDPSRPDRGVIEGRGTARVPIDLRYVGHWFTMCFGPPVTLADTPGVGTHTHTWASGGPGDEITGYTIEQQHEDVTAGSVYFKHIGVIVDSMTVTLEAAGRAYLDLNLFSHGFEANAASEVGTPAELAFTRFSQFQNFVSKGGAPLGKIVRLNMPFANNHTLERYIGGGGDIDEIGPGQTNAQGELVARVADLTLIQNSIDSDVFTLDFGYSIDANESLTFKYAQSEFGRASPGLDGPGGAETRFPLAPSRTASLPMLQVVLVNDVAAY